MTWIVAWTVAGLVASADAAAMAWLAAHNWRTSWEPRAAALAGLYMAPERVEAHVEDGRRFWS